MKYVIGNMGESALTIYMSGKKKHCELALPSDWSIAGLSFAPTSKNVSFVDCMIINASTVHAEIWWALKVSLSIIKMLMWWYCRNICSNVSR